MRDYETEECEPEEEAEDLEIEPGSEGTEVPGLADLEGLKQIIPSMGIEAGEPGYSPEKEGGPSEETLGLVGELWTSGWSALKLSKHFGVNVSTIRRWLKMPKSGEAIKRIRQLVTNRLTNFAFDAIGKVLGKEMELIQSKSPSIALKACHQVMQHFSSIISADEYDSRISQIEGQLGILPAIGERMKGTDEAKKRERDRMGRMKPIEEV